VGTLENNEAVVSVRDYGVGIPAAEHARIYDRYFRASTATGIAGTGIGLNLVSQIIEIHGGRISLESDEGKGTTFSIHLPIRNLSQNKEGTPKNECNPFDQLLFTAQPQQSAS
jgi:signal transduction histidine kinase